MSRHIDYSAAAHPLQRRSAAATAKAEGIASPYSLHAGLIATAPRLALVFALAGLLQVLIHGVGR